MQQEFFGRLSGICVLSALIRDCPMDRYTTFRIGGPADALMDVGDEQELTQALALAQEYEVPVAVMGNGSNLLVRDEGFRGLIVRLGGRWNRISVQGNLLIACSGALLPAAAQAAADHGLNGLVFACGIPGSVGGAAVMNAGAYGGEMAQVVDHVTVLRGKETVTIPQSELQYGYRHSALMEAESVVTKVAFRLAPGDRDEILKRMAELKTARNEKQPVNLPSAGSAFKRPQGDFAARLIDTCGLKGMSVGGAQVSEKHAGFIVNTGGATCQDVLDLVHRVREIVLTQTGRYLELEIKVI